jgi:hypothetical protein
MSDLDDTVTPPDPIQEDELTTGNGNGNGHLPWNEKLLVPFTGEAIGLRPQLWCAACRKSQNKACGQVMYDQKHEVKKCPQCKQKISVAHLHLSYVGHADLTQRLLEVDPAWTWEPLYKNADPATLQAAIATGSPEIVKLVLDNSPPEIVEFEIHGSDGKFLRTERGMWLRLTLHDDDGKEVTMIGFGDAKGKSGWEGDVLKEIIGDGLRNAGMRRGAGLHIWQDHDHEQEKRETRSQTPPGAMAAAAEAFSDDADTAADQRGEHADKDAQVFADLAWHLAGQGSTTEQVRAAAHEPAARKRKLGAWVHPPWDPDLESRKRLSDVLNRIKRITDGKEPLPQPDPPAAGARVISAANIAEVPDGTGA